MAEQISASLIREFLSRKGLKNTLAVFDTELPRTEHSISKRTALARSIHIESLVKRNKIEYSTAATSLSILEVLIQHIISNPIDCHDDQSVKKSTVLDQVRIDAPVKTPLPLVKTPPPLVKTPPPLVKTPLPLTSPPFIADSPNGKPITFNTKLHPLISGKRPQLVSGISKTGFGSRDRRHTPSSRGLIKTDDSLLTQGRRKLVSHDISHDYKSKTAVSKITTDNNDMLLELSHDQSHDMGSKETVLFEDIEDIIIDTPTISVKEPSLHIKGTPITSETAQLMRELVFGTAKGPSFNNEWRLQGLTLSPHITYGLVQHKGGPCGLLACCQAYLLKDILFSDGSQEMSIIPELSKSQQTELLVNTLCNILWTVQTNDTAIVTLKSYGTKTNIPKTIQYTPDGITEKLLLYEFNNYSQMKNFIIQHIGSFMTDNDGIILLLYSIILTHTMTRIKSEMDNPNNSLIGLHGYCSQELVNLMLTGTACSNVFDGKVTLDTSIKDSPILRGVSSQSVIGYLTLYEHYGVCQVGNYYKNPTLPIWVVCSESHYSVLFGLTRTVANSNGTSFSLHYYDGLAHFTEPVILEITIDDSIVIDKNIANTDTTPPLELIIKTRWSNCRFVKWNCEPLL